MEFGYKVYSDGVSRPVVHVTLSFQEKELEYELLVDSGADMCMFGMEVALFLGYDFSDMEKGYVAGVGGEPMVYYKAPVTIEVAGTSIVVEAGFLPNVSQFDYGVAGRKDFFEQFVVTFYERQKLLGFQKI